MMKNYILLALFVLFAQNGFAQKNNWLSDRPLPNGETDFIDEMRKTNDGYKRTMTIRMLKSYEAKFPEGSEGGNIDIDACVHEFNLRVTISTEAKSNVPVYILKPRTFTVSADPFIRAREDAVLDDNLSVPVKGAKPITWFTFGPFTTWNSFKKGYMSLRQLNEFCKGELQFAITKTKLPAY